ncbi:GntR family transcriptional regulator [Devosia sp.]|uniref:GntR family transcriptional regulator n=1 Tax=Devosia sp. TaxID=1871048 RepID=UPI0019F09C14|nr:GntR family transcriptional regulator [Devosia sp.]MBE0582023.1 GntR family transcriptional regulator [Devosia sp.]
MKSTVIHRAGDAAAGLARPTSLAGNVYDAIFAQLMSLQIPPGARITVDTLVRELNVSHTPIREALGRLEGEGLVLRAHLVGYRAAPQVSRARFDELYELRLMLEPEAAAKATARMDEAGLTALQQLAGVMAADDGADEQLRYSDFARRDAEFHDKILEIAGNGLVRDVLRMQHTHFHIFRLMYHRLVTAEALDEHEALLDAFRKGDPKRAREAMLVHIHNSRTRLLPAFA